MFAPSSGHPTPLRPAKSIAPFALAPPCFGYFVGSLQVGQVRPHPWRHGKPRTFTMAASVEDAVTISAVLGGGAIASFAAMMLLV